MTLFVLLRRFGCSLLATQYIFMQELIGFTVKNVVPYQVVDQDYQSRYSTPEEDIAENTRTIGALTGTTTSARPCYLREACSPPSSECENAVLTTLNQYKSYKDAAISSLLLDNASQYKHKCS